MRFTIRDLLWLMVVVALTLTLGLGWLNERRASSIVRRAVANQRKYDSASTMTTLKEQYGGYAVQVRVARTFDRLDAATD